MAKEPIYIRNANPAPIWQIIALYLFHSLIFIGGCISGIGFLMAYQKIEYQHPKYVEIQTLRKGCDYIYTPALSAKCDHDIDVIIFFGDRHGDAVQLIQK